MYCAFRVFSFYVKTVKLVNVVVILRVFQAVSDAYTVFTTLYMVEIL